MFFQYRGDTELQDTAIKQFIKIPLEYGWDKEHGGLYYYLDSRQESPTQLEWNMKLWWVHCEALVAELMAYKLTNDADHWSWFKATFDYVCSHVRSAHIHTERERE